MATYFYGHRRTRTNGQWTRRGLDALQFEGPSTLVCSHHARWSRRGRTHYLVCGPLWPHSSMATLVRARMAGARGVVGMQKCWRDPRRRFARTTPGGRVVDAHRTRGLDFNDQIRLWPPKNTHDCPVQAVLLGCRNIGGTPDIGLHPPSPLVASRTHAPPDVRTCMATHVYAHRSTRTNGPCKRRGWDADLLEGLPASVCTHHTRWSRRRRTPYAWFELPWPEVFMATQVRARMASASGAVGMQNSSWDPGHWFAPTTSAARVLDARNPLCVDIYGHILLWPPQYAHEWSGRTAWLGCRNVWRTPGVGFNPPYLVVASWTHALRGVWTSTATYLYGQPRTRKNCKGTRRCWDAEVLPAPPKFGLHPPRPLVASWTHALPGVWTSMPTYMYGHPSTRTNGQCTRRGWDAEILGGPSTLVCIDHARRSSRVRMHCLVCGLPWPHTCMATPVRARTASSRGAVGMHYCWGDLRYWFAPGVSKRNSLMRTSRVVFKRNSLTLFFKSCGCRLASLRFGFEIDTLPVICQASVVRYALAKYAQSIRA